MSEHKKTVKKDNMACITSSGTLTLNADFTVADVRTIQRFLHQVLESVASDE
tara:strand:- start:5337 stop:5492 length:156 start_codon:yes stop_codon:yes gene_type:complete